MVLKWNLSLVESNLKVTQIHGILFTNDGKILLKLEDGKYSFIGGKPEKYERTYDETLIREVLEEVNTTIKNIVYLGYQEVDEENGIPPYAQVRMLAIIEDILDIKPDPDTNKIYERVLVSPEEAIDLLGWGKMAEIQVKCAVSAFNKLNSK